METDGFDENPDINNVPMEESQVAKLAFKFNSMLVCVLAVSLPIQKYLQEAI